jgi:Leucine-rich repeat (LRR) protein
MSHSLLILFCLVNCSSKTNNQTVDRPPNKPAHQHKKRAISSQPITPTFLKGHGFLQTSKGLVRKKITVQQFCKLLGIHPANFHSPPNSPIRGSDDPDPIVLHNTALGSEILCVIIIDNPITAFKQTKGGTKTEINTRTAVTAHVVFSKNKTGSNVPTRPKGKKAWKKITQRQKRPDHPNNSLQKDREKPFDGPGKGINVTKAVEAIEDLGGVVWYAKGFKNRVVEVSLEKTKVRDRDLLLVSNMTNLQELKLAGTHITDKGLIHLKNLARLEVLDLSRTKVRGPGLLNLKDLTLLKDLYMGGCEITDSKLRTIARLKNLRRLFLDRTSINGSGFPHLKRLHKLYYLNCYKSHISDRNLIHLSQLTGLGHIDFSRTKIGDTGIAFLTNLSNLQIVWLSHTQITDKGLPHLNKLSALEYVDLSHTRVTSTGIKQLTKLSNLTKLNLCATDITDGAFLAIQRFRRLTELDIRYTRVTVKGIRHLTLLTRLKELTVDLNQLSPPSLQALNSIPSDLTLFVDFYHLSKAKRQQIIRALPNIKVSPIVIAQPRRPTP